MTRSLPVPALPALLVLLAACGTERTAEATPVDPPTAVRVAPLQVEPFADPIPVTGRVAAAEEVALAFRVGGFVASVHVRPGDAVAAGEVLARLQDDEVEAALRAARADRDEAARAEARLTRLHADSVVPLAQLESARDARSRAEAALTAAEFSRDRAVIRAPAAGRVLDRSIEPGAWVSPGAPALSFASTGRGWIVEVGLTDRQLLEAGPGTAATVRLDAFPEAAVPGRVVEIAAAPSPGTGLYRTEIALDRVPDGVRSGFVARVELDPGREVARLVLPPESIADVADGAATIFTLAEDGDVVRAARVRLVGFRGDRIVAAGDLAAGTPIVTAGAAFLRDGDRVLRVEGDR